MKFRVRAGILLAEVRCLLMWIMWWSLDDDAICVDDDGRGVRGTWTVQSFHLFLRFLFCTRTPTGTFPEVNAHDNFLFGAL